MADENFDYCEYVYNPLMRQYQAMIRLLQVLSNSETQQDCNDIECFAPNDLNSPTNVLNSVGGGSGSSMVTYLPMLLVWMLFAFAMFTLRPQSMRQKSVQQKSVHPAMSESNDNTRPRFRDNEDDDSFAS